jgi:hypothetical protein
VIDGTRLAPMLAAAASSTRSERVMSSNACAWKFSGYTKT